MNNAEKCREIAVCLKNLNPKIASLVETQVKHGKEASIKNKLGISGPLLITTINMLMVEYEFLGMLPK